MAYEQRDLTGSLFKNERKEADTHSDYKGSALIGGTEFWLDAWINTAKDGSKYMSLKFKAKEARQGSYGDSQTQSATHRAPAPAFDDDEDSVPF
jgi:uncharacterized protein (DUF736 family)